MKLTFTLISFFVFSFGRAQDFTLTWAKAMGSPNNNDIGISTAVDGAGNVYTTGNFGGTADFNPDPAATFNLTVVGTVNAFISKLDASGNFVWAKQITSTQEVRSTSNAVDASGNSYTIGYYLGTADFNPDPAVTFNLTSVGEDIFIVKLDANGNFVWAASFGGPTFFDQGHSITLDATGNVYATGHYNGTADFNPDPAVTNNLVSSGLDAFVLKLNAAGNYIWAKRMGGASNDYGQAIAVDANSNVLTTGYFSGTADFNPDPAATFNLTATAGADIFISKLNAAGDFVWAKGMGGTLEDRGLGIAVDASGNVITTGYFQGTADLNPDPSITTSITSAGSTDIFITKLDAAGNTVFSNNHGGTSADAGLSVKSDATGNVYTTGYFRVAVDFNPDPAIAFTMTSAGLEDIFIQKLNSAGNLILARQMGGVSADGGNSIHLDATGNLFLTGYFNGTADFNPDPAATFNVTSSGFSDIFVVKLGQTPAPNQAPVVTASGGSTSYTEGTPVIVDNAIIVTDGNDVNLASATVSITGGFQPGEDVLLFTNQNGITGSYNATTGVLTLTGSSSVANYQTALRSVSYNNTSSNPNTANRTISFQVNDGTANSNIATKTVTVTAVNNAPVVTASAGNTAYTSGTPAVVDNAITVTDADNANLVSATVSITGGFQSGQDVLLFTNQNGITGSYNATTGVLSLTGSATIANYQTALRSVQYNNTSLTPNVANRTISFQVNDGTSNSNIATKTVVLTAVNNAPVVTASGGNTSYTEGTPVLIDGSITVTDADNANLASATISISSGFQTSEDVLVFTNQNGITGTYNAATGVLSLTGSSSVANYQAALRSVQYNNTSLNPNTANRIVSFQVNDGTAASNVATKTVTVTAVNNAPTVTASGGMTVFIPGTPVVIDAAITATDPDNASLATATVSITSGFQASEDILLFTNQNGITGSYNAATGVLSLSGLASIANYQNALRSVMYNNSAITPNPASRTISFQLNDGATSGNIGTKTIMIQAGPVPVILSSIRIQSNGCIGTLIWITEQEINSKHFEIQQSLDGATFYKIATVPASGYSVSPKQYQFKLNLTSHPGIFRLKMVDMDGSSKFSDVVTATGNCNENTVRVFPNPVKDILTITGLTSGMKLLLINSLGQVVKTATSRGGTDYFMVDDLPSGMFNLQIISNKKIKTIALIKE